MSAMAGLKLPKGFEQYSLPTRGGQSADIYSKLFSMFPEMMQNAQGGGSGFDAIEGQARQDFSRKTAPGIANRYAGSGIGASSGMQNSLAAAGQDLELGLAGKRIDYMDKSMQRVLQLGNILLKNPDIGFGYQRTDEDDGSSTWDKILGIGLPIAGAAAGFIPGFGPMIGGPAGGAAIGGTIAKGFSRR
jgi:hypothetical protein